MNLLVTGGAGFIGSNFIRMVMEKYENYHVLNLDLLTYAGNLENLKDVESNLNYTFVKGDIGNADLVDYLIRVYKIDAIVNFAAESHVDRSIENPGVFVHTNVNGTLNLLEQARKHNIAKFVQISTDEVYGSLGAEGLFYEDTPLAPNSPYSASKASADLLVRSFYKTYNMNVNITRCSNNYGPFHFPEKLIPLIITNALQEKELPIYGDGMNIRDWLHVNDHCAAIDLVLHDGKPGEVYNVGGGNERTNREIVELITGELGVSERFITYVKDRPGHDRRYAINSLKLQEELGWAPQYTFEKGMKETIQWYKENFEWWKSIKMGSYMEYYQKQYGEQICIV